VFKLDPLLEQRKRVERDHQRRVAEAEAERRSLEDELTRLTESVASSRHALRDSMRPAEHGVATKIDINATRWQAHASMGADVRARTLAVKLAGVLKRLEDVRAVLTEAARERRVVERLRERRLEAFQRECARREMRELDDLNTTRHGSSPQGTTT
jgi:flagellar FliJ protein